MNNALIGYTGTVGKSILDLYPNINYKYNSKNIKDIHNKYFDTLYIAGVSANKWFANNHSEEDKQNIQKLIDDLSFVKANKVFLISTIDIDYFPNEPYSINRLYFENCMKKQFNNLYIIRLPGLIGKHIKKNFIHDCKYLIPEFFKDNIIDELKDYYEFDGSVYRLKHNINTSKLIEILKENNITSLKFSNKNSIYQYFDLSKLDDLFNKAENENIRLMQVSSYPISTNEVCDILGFDINLLGNNQPIVYNKPTQYYLLSKEDIIKCIKKYMEE